MHIAYITSEFVTEKQRGGLATYLSNIATIMNEKGHKITIITLSEQNGRIHYDKNVEVIQVCTCDLAGREISLVCNSWKLYQALIRENKKEKIDIVQAANYNAVGIFRSYAIPTVVRISSDSSMWRNATKYRFDCGRALREKILEDFLELWCVKNADASFAPSYACGTIVQKRSGKKIAVIETPYISKKYIFDESVYQKNLNGKKYLLFNSSLSRLKGTHIGIEATEQIMRKYPDLYMVYVGYDYGLAQKNGNSQSVIEILRRLSKKYDGRVIYLGHLKQEKLFPIIEKAYACVLPSRIDNLPNSCIEAMALGSIVIGTYGASFEQLIRNKENGLLIKIDSSNALVRAVDYLVNLQKEEYLEMKKKAVATIERLYPQKIYEKMIRFYKKVIEDF